MSKKLNVVIVGAHADDCELFAGGLALRYLKQGHCVTFIVVTDGSAGHHLLTKKQIIKRRYSETRKVADYLGIEYIVLNNPDGWLEADIENRKKFITILRQLKPDLVITHGTNDYHPDHRNTAILVADTAYMINVPLCVPDAEPVGKDVVYYAMSFKPQRDSNLTIILPIDEVVYEKLRIVSFHESQVFEWLPWIEKTSLGTLSTEAAERLQFLKSRYLPDWNRILSNYRQIYPEQFTKVSCSYVEAFEACPWGSVSDVGQLAKLFPFSDAVILNSEQRKHCD
jgi:LmbE family N-acetylglucosaminyl deacetylase